jgi:hypothetical protein
MKITKITIGRLFNLGNYEHVRYELTVEVGELESAAAAVRGMEAILSGLKPLRNDCLTSASDLQRKAEEIERMKTMPAVEWERNYGHCKGTPTEVIERYQKALEEAAVKTHSAVERARTARQLFDDLGGAAQWKDAKLDWSDYDSDEF